MRSGAPVYPPDSRFPLRTIIGTRGLPAITSGKPGDLATDPETGKVYVKGPTGWVFWRKVTNIQAASPFCTNGDPAFWVGPGLIPIVFALTGVNGGSPNFYTTLTWNYPKFAAHPDTVFHESPMILKQVVLQRSTSSIATPYAQDGAFHITAGTDYIVSDATWTTLLDLRPNLIVWPGPDPLVGPDPSTYGLATSYQDNTTPNHIFNYRLLAQIYFGSTPGDVFREMDWNVVTAVKPYQLINPAPTVDVSGLHIHWQ